MFIRLYEFLKKMFSKESHSKPLFDFLQNVYWGHSLSIDQAKKNLELGLVELVYAGGQHAANGLLISSDGFFITNYHCVRNGLAKQMRIRMHNGGRYPISYICAFSEVDDIAIVKAAIPGEQKALTYKFHDGEFIFPAKVTNLVSVTRRDGKIDIKGGSTRGIRLEKYYTREKDLHRDHMVTYDSRGCQGDSGSVVVNMSGEIIGLNSAGDCEGRAFVVRWPRVLEFISANCAK